MIIDIHNHLLPEVDDGSKSLEESVQVIRQAVNAGTTKMILTPHYAPEFSYDKSVTQLRKQFNRLKKEIKKADIPVELFLGNEIMLNKDTDLLLEQKKVLPLADTNYVLVEFPMTYYLDDFDEYLYNISLSYQIIIAHPERYSFVKDDWKFVERWTKEGYLLQSNGDSLEDRGKAKIIYKLIETGQLHFIASDSHGYWRTAVLTKPFKKIEKLFGTDVANFLFYENAETLLEGGSIQQMTPHRRRCLGGIL